MSVPAFKIFEEMLAQNYKLKQFNHNWLLSKLCENNKFLEAHMVSDMMLQRGITPKHSTKRFYLLIFAFVFCFL